MPMSTREAENSKKTLRDNQRQFKELQKSAEGVQEDFNKMLLAEIAEIDARAQKSTRESTRRKKVQVMKGMIMQTYTDDDRSSEVVPVDGEMKSGSVLFTQSCFGCHSLDVDDNKPRIGPSLGIIYNRKAGSHLNYANYSQTMLKADFYWSPLNLYRFMADPKSVVKGTTCGLVERPIKSEEHRADLITLLREFTEEMALNYRLQVIKRVGWSKYQSNLHAGMEERLKGSQREKQEMIRERRI